MYSGLAIWAVLPLCTLSTSAKQQLSLGSTFFSYKNCSVWNFAMSRILDSDVLLCCWAYFGISYLPLGANLFAPKNIKQPRSQFCVERIPDSSYDYIDITCCYNNVFFLDRHMLVLPFLKEDESCVTTIPNVNPMCSVPFWRNLTGIWCCSVHAFLVPDILGF